MLTVTLNRPEKLNAINLPVSQALDEATWRFGDPRGPSRDDHHRRRSLLLCRARHQRRGTGRSDARSKATPTTTIAARRKYRQRHHVLHDEMESIEKPIILAAQGPCLGLGLEMAASCDFRFCTPTTHFGLPEVGRLGVIAGSGGISRVTRLVGPHWSKWISMAGKNVDAETALRIGLVHEIYPEDEFMDARARVRRGLVEISPDALGRGEAHHRHLHRRGPREDAPHRAPRRRVAGRQPAGGRRVPTCPRRSGSFPPCDSLPPS